METGLEGKPWYVAASVAAGLAVALVIGTHFFILKGMKQEYVRAESRLTELQQKIQEGRIAQQSLPQFREQIERLQLELDKLLRILPSRRNTEDLLRRIRSLTEQGDFRLMRFAPAQPQNLDFYSEWPIRIELEGTYHNLALFFDRISRFSRIINIEALSIRAMNKTDGGHTIRADFTAKTFLYNDDEEEEELAQ